MMPPKKEVTKDRILAAALENIREDGLDAMTARSLARRLKCSTQPVYRAFSSMDSLKSEVYDIAQQFALDRIRSFRDCRYPPPLCPAIGYLQLAHDERQLFRSVYLSGYSAAHAKNNLMIGEEMIASHAPDSSRLRNAGINVLKRIYSKISICIAGLATMINTGAIDFSIEEAAGMVTDIYETIVTGEIASNKQEPSISAAELGAKIGSGANADVFEFGEGKVVKLFRNTNQLQSLYNERRNHLFIQQAGLPVPRVYEPMEINGLPGLVYEHIKGPTIVDRMFTPNGTDDIRMLARLMHKIHSVSVQYLDSRHMPRVKGVLNWQIDHGKGLTDTEKASIKDFLQSLPDAECLCHGDLNPLNVIVRDGSPVVIDWQGASIGNPEYDVMQLILIWRYAVIPLNLAPKAFISEFYLRREELNRLFVGEYVRISGIPEKAIYAWLVPVAAAKLNTGICGEESDVLLRVIREQLQTSPT